MLLKDYLKHMLIAAETIDRYAAGLDQTAFLASEGQQGAVNRKTEVTSA